MLFEKLFAYHTYYLVIYKDHFIVRLLETKSEYQMRSQEPMSSKSLLVSNMNEAKRMLKAATGLLSQGFSLTKPLIVIHPTKLLKPEITPIEKKLYEELAKVIKARKVIIHTGELLEFEALEALVEAEDSVEV